MGSGTEGRRLFRQRVGEKGGGKDQRRRGEKQDGLPDHVVQKGLREPLGEGEESVRGDGLSFKAEHVKSLSLSLPWGKQSVQSERIVRYHRPQKEPFHHRTPAKGRDVHARVMTGSPSGYTVGKGGREKASARRKR